MVMKTKLKRIFIGVGGVAATTIGTVAGFAAKSDIDEKVTKKDIENIKKDVENINEIWNKVYAEQFKTISELKTKIAFIWGSVLVTKRINRVREQQIIILQKNIKDILSHLKIVDFHLDSGVSFGAVDYKISRLKGEIKQELVKIKKSIQDIKSNKEATQDNSR